MTVFLSRGWDDNFQKHVRQSMSSPISDPVRENLIDLLEDRSSDRTSLIQLLNDETTAWGVQNKDFQHFRKMEQGDYHILRTEGNDPETRFYSYIQQVDFIIDEEISAPTRKDISEMIWDDWEYEYLWFSKTTGRINCSERAFDQLIQQADPSFRTQKFFRTRSVNFKPLDPEVIECFGGDRQFIEEVCSL